MTHNFKFLTVSLYFFAVTKSSDRQAEILEHLELGRDLSAKGHFNEALSHYHAAVGK